jgi:vitamin B12 transporter
MKQKSMTMLRTCLFLFSQLVLSTIIYSQATIAGTIHSSKHEPLAGASISIENSYDGATSASDGHFSFTTTEKGQGVLVVTLLGYKDLRRPIELNASLKPLALVLQEQVTELQAVTVTAGSFEASDKKRTTILKPLDIVTTAGAHADIVGALKTLPGTQQVNEADGLFVRGGTGAETKVFIDGMMISNPFYSSVPDIGQRARFSPLLFKGTIFSTGGYSALFGDALSSALILETRDLPSRTEANFLISSPQLTATVQQLSKSKKESIGATINYANLAPYFHVVPQRIKYNKPYEALNGDVNARKKIGSNGILKFYGYANYSRVALSRPSLDYAATDNHFQVKNRNLLAIATLQQSLSASWKLNAGVAWSNNRDRIATYAVIKDSSFGNFSPDIENTTLQGRVVLTRNLKGISKLNIGTEYRLVIDRIYAADSIPFIRRTDHMLSPFIEADIYITTNFVGRIGARHEYSSLAGKHHIAPRISVAYKLNDHSQASFAFGHYYQKQEAKYLFRESSLDYSRATHYILNFQRVKADRTFRTELFYKKYKRLLTILDNDPAQLGNDGDGYAKGIDIFWRDRATIKNMDYWVSYTWLDTKRKFLDYPTSVQPNFAATHTANLVVKRFVQSISTNLGLTYTYASGRPYRNPNRPVNDFMSDHTIDFHSVGLSANYLTMIGKANAVVMLNISNVLGSEQVYGYNYSQQRNARGNYTEAAIRPPARRFIFLAVYMSLGVDRRQQIIDN